MKSVKLEINGKIVEAEEGTTVLQAAIANKIYIPSLCYHADLEPHGGCRLCMVEISREGRTRLVASCAYPVQEGLVVRTNTDEIKKIRSMILELLYPAVSDERLVAEYGVAERRFRTEQSDCSQCGLCVRYCAEVAGKHVCFFKGRGIERKMAIIPELEAECLSCGKCFTVCSGGWIVSHDAARV